MERTFAWENEITIEVANGYRLRQSNNEDFAGTFVKVDETKLLSLV